MQINWTCFLNRSGYAQASLDYIKCIKNNIKEHDLKISLLHSNPEQISISNEMYLYVMNSMKKSTEKDCLQIFHCIPEMQRRMPKVGKTIGFATFETFSPPDNWVKTLNTNSAVICPSEFNIKVFENAGVKTPIHYVPHCFDSLLYNKDVTRLEEKTNDKFTFLFMGTWKKRKGYHILLEAFMKEFDKNDNVELLIKTDRYTLAKKSIEDFKINLGLIGKELAPILVEGRVFNELDLPKFIKMADCYISPTLGEGFGIPGMFAMALEVPVIITNFSGVQEYANEETANLIEPNGFIVYNDLDAIPQFRSKKWANITVESVQKSMREILNNKEKAKNKASKAYEYVNGKFTYEKVSNHINSMLRNI